MPISEDDNAVCIEAKNVHKTYQSSAEGVVAIENLDLEIYDREFFCLLGPTGCGKSTFLRILGGLLEPEVGSVNIRKEIPEDRFMTNMVFQEHGIFPWKTVIDNVAFGLKMRGIDKKTRYRRARQYIKKVNLSEFENSYPHELSGGMKQRVGVARAFTNDPEILLMDEPFGSLDVQTKEYLQEELLSLWNETKKTVVYVTHDVTEAIKLGDRLGVMSARPGSVKEILTVDINRPRTRENIPPERVDELQAAVWDILDGEVKKSVERDY